MTLETSFSNWIMHASVPWLANVRDYLHENLLHRWIGPVMKYKMLLTQWPTRTPGLTLCDFFRGGTTFESILSLIRCIVASTSLNHQMRPESRQWESPLSEVVKAAFSHLRYPLPSSFKGSETKKKCACARSVFKGSWGNVTTSTFGTTPKEEVQCGLKICQGCSRYLSEHDPNLTTAHRRLTPVSFRSLNPEAISIPDDQALR
ncbi:hypothetical protein TNCV_4644962 [Trichonephila clavipes]|nr:hypothetical protein TNCV_4644962 [Trichonephila clavipes]